MPRVHKVEHARKDYPDAGIEKGDTYYYWSFRYGGKRMSKTYPKPSQLTQSPFLIEFYSIQEEINALADPEDLDDILSRIDNLRDECQDSLDNMPEALQDTSESGMLLQERIDALESWYDELESIDRETDEELSEDEIEERREEMLEEIRSCDSGL